jgi:hypothetical protein
MMTSSLVKLADAIVSGLNVILSSQRKLKGRGSKELEAVSSIRDIGVLLSKKVSSAGNEADALSGPRGVAPQPPAADYSNKIVLDLFTVLTVFVLIFGVIAVWAGAWIIVLSLGPM